MINIWSLPKSVNIDGTQYTINTDFRDVLEIISILTDVEKPEFLRWNVAVGLFFNEEVCTEHLLEAMNFLSSFISYNADLEKPGPVLMDWEQDAQMIIGDINVVAGTDVRSLPYLHWWTFLSYFNGIGEGQLSTIVSIRKKKQDGKKMEKWEQEYYREHRNIVNLRKKDTKEDLEMKNYFDKWL